jgi:hypothetical protein
MKPHDREAGTVEERRRHLAKFEHILEQALDDDDIDFAAAIFKRFDMPVGKKVTWVSQKVWNRELEPTSDKWFALLDTYIGDLNTDELLIEEQWSWRRRATLLTNGTSGSSGSSDAMSAFTD